MLLNLVCLELRVILRCIYCVVASNIKISSNYILSRMKEILILNLIEFETIVSKIKIVLENFY